ncbi:MAG: alcohol dehydrogenase catalytic domain-containing protein [Nocardioidaceae bacterium]|nr:alcohol dehydrogenase catalytic domain-containing protein [Nocardioidaceae bacterium]
MRGVVLPGDSTVRHVEQEVPTPGHGQVLLAMKASSICGSDIRAIYREHLGHGPEAYQGVIAGHEPCGQVVAVGPGCTRLREGDRVVVYHIAGCGQCDECRAGYLIGCTAPTRAAYGWQRDGGHADYLLAEERTCLALPDSLSYVDGALVSCGFGTAYEALLRLDVSGRDSLLVTGLGPVGLAAAMLARAMGAAPVVGTDVSAERRALAVDLGIVDEAVDAAEASFAPTFTTTLDASGNATARQLALASTATWGRCAFVGEGGQVSFDVSQQLIHRQVTLYGSWVTSIGHMADLLHHLDRWALHPDRIVTDTFTLDDAAAAYELADRGTSGKVCLTLG